MPNILKRSRCGFVESLCLCLCLLFTLPVQAQGGEPVPRDEEAELIFDQALEAFEAADYGMAYRRFRLVYTSYPLNRKTTASILMAGKALYRDGSYQGAAELLSSFIDEYPTSSYVDDASRTLSLARQHLAQGETEARVIRLGILLPLSGDDAALSQAMFNGIRLAVDEHNLRADPPVRMIFRDSRDEAGQARAAVESLLQEGVDLIIGPLYSEEARAAAAVAERSRVVLVAPLATDESVSEGRNYVFQANPTITRRGRLMARFAVRSLRLDDFGVVAEFDDSISERMAEGFQDEAIRLGASVPFYKLLPSASGWYNLPDALEEDALSGVEAVYLPISGGNASTLINAALSGLDQMQANVRVLGNAEWHDLSTRVQASTYSTTYTNDFYVNEASPDVETFVERYRALAGEAPSRLGYTGYDLTRFVLDLLARNPDRPLPQVLREAPPYQGLGLRLDFEEDNVNEAMYYLRYRNGQMELLR